MKLHRSLALPFALLMVGATAAACSDDEVEPAFDGGSVNDAGNDAGATTAPKITSGTALPALVGGAAAAPVQLAATGSTPITWSISAGAAPLGMKLDSATGTYTGTPLAAGSFTFTVTATNAAGADSIVLTQAVSAPAADATVLLVDGKLSSVATSFPSGASTPAALTGLADGDALVSIDRRPMNGYLYGLGFNSVAGTVTVYSIDPTANLAKAVGAPVTYSDAATAGSVIGMDFNPTVDRIRVVTSTGQNFRLNPNSGGAAVADTRDGALNVAAAATLGIAETAYTNNAMNVSVTTQYTVDPTTSTLYIQNPPNNGVLTTPVSIAPAITNMFGFDIAPGVNVSTANAVATGVGFGVVKQAGASTDSLVSIDLTTGALGVIGSLPFTGTRGFTVQKAPARSIIGLTAAGEIVRFFDNAPATTSTPVAVGGLTAGETLVGIDFRPATGQLYGLGLDLDAGTGTLYRIDPQGGAATAIGSPSSISFTTASLGTAGDTFGIDFNTAVDRLRVVSSAGLNFRINPDTGAVVDGDPATDGIQPDGALTGAAAGLDAVAYTNGPPAMGATGITAEYGLDATTNALHLVTVPNVGTLGPAIPVTLGGAALDFTSVSAFDIPQSVTTATANTAPASGFGYAALNVGGATNLYKIDLVTGVATLVGSIGAGTTSLVGMTIGR